MLVSTTTKLFILTSLVFVNQAEAEPCPVPEFRNKVGEKEIVAVVEGADSKLPCPVKAPDTDSRYGLNVYWEKGNVTLQPAEHSRMRIKPNKYLKIKRTQKEDAGHYICIAQNSCGGKNVLEVQLFVDSPTRDPNRNTTPAAPKFTVSLARRIRNLIAVPVGNSVKLDCSAEGYPRPTVVWYKDGALFQERKDGSSIYLNKRSMVVVMRDVVPSDSGIYTCNVSNRYGWINHSYSVDVHERVRARPVVLEMKNLTVYEGQNATLLCKALSDSKPHFQWLRWFSSPSSRSVNGSQIQHPNHTYEIIKQNEQSDHQHLVVPTKQSKFEFHGVKLTLINVTKNNEGKYTCIVGNAVGYAVEQAYIFVRDRLGPTRDPRSRKPTPAAPKFTVSLVKRIRNLIAVPVGNSVKLDCSAEGYPRPTVVWYKDGALFQERKDGSSIYLNKVSTKVVMRDVVPSDSGIYTCNVSNRYGWINHSYSVDVHERVRARPVVLEMKNVTVYQGQNATLLCKALSDSMPHFQWLRWFSSPSNRSANGSQIQHPHHSYEIIKQNEQNDNQHVVVATKQSKFAFHGVKLTLINVTKNNEGKYTCIVGNAVGYAEEQAYIFVRDRLALGSPPQKRLKRPPALTEHSHKVFPNVPIASNFHVDHGKQ